MMRFDSLTSSCSLSWYGAPLALAISLWSPDAQAGIEACGDIHVEAQAKCEMLVEGGCQAECTPVHMEAACAAELRANCAGQCTELPSVECQGSCQADCEAECLVDPGSFDCRAACNSDCQGQCSGSCSSSDSECFASCEATCDASCEASCEATPPSAECSGSCEASCQGSCEASANLDCQVDCQADGYVECKADLQGGCEARCQQPEGALFCDGQYVDHGGRLEECVAALEAAYDIEVEGYAEGSCVPGHCEGEAGGSISCSVRGEDSDDDDNGLPIGLAVMTVLVGVGLRRR